VRHFLARIAAEEGKRVRSISAEALALLGRYRWPGNVRQLENTVFRAVVLAEGDSIGIDEFPQIAAQVTGQSATPFAVPQPPMPHHLAEPIPTMIEAMPPLGMDPSVEPVGASFGPGMLTLLDSHGDVRPLEDLESEVIRFAIAHYRGQMSEVARRLQIGRSTLYRKLDSIGMTDRSAAERKEAAEAH
jgi:DNA-binding NtrC family response regulator